MKVFLVSFVFIFSYLGPCTLGHLGCWKFKPLLSFSSWGGPTVWSLSFSPTTNSSAGGDEINGTLPELDGSLMKSIDQALHWRHEHRVLPTGVSCVLVLTKRRGSEMQRLSQAQVRAGIHQLITVITRDGWNHASRTAKQSADWMERNVERQKIKIKEISFNQSFT